MTRDKGPNTQTPPPPPQTDASAIDVRQVAIIALDAEIAQLKARLATLERQGGNEETIEQIRTKLHLRALQRVKLR